jgi:hypothetical protein
VVTGAAVSKLTAGHEWPLPSCAAGASPIASAFARNRRRRHVLSQAAARWSSGHVVVPWARPAAKPLLGMDGPWREGAQRLCARPRGQAAPLRPVASEARTRGTPRMGNARPDPRYALGVAETSAPSRRIWA